MKRLLIAGLLSTGLCLAGTAVAQVPPPAPVVPYGAAPAVMNPAPIPGLPAPLATHGNALPSTPPAPGPTTFAVPGGVAYGDPISTASCGDGCCQRGILAHINDRVKHPLTFDSLRATGYLDAGYMYNANNPASNFNGPFNAIDREEVMFNQAYLTLEKTRNTCNGLDWGARVDAMYGFDFFLAQSRGFESTQRGIQRWNSGQYYGLVLPQLYAEVGTADYSVKFGRFYSLIGYESMMSPQNFFYSHSYSYMFANPFTHWGALATVKSGNLTLDAGLVNGWNALDRESDEPNFLARVRWVNDSASAAASFAVITGNERTLINNRDRNRTQYSLIVDLNPSCDFEYVFHHFLGLQDDGVRQRGVAWWYGIDQYAYYRIADCLLAGARLEWFRDEDGTRVGLNRPDNPNKRPFRGNFYALSMGLNYSPIPNLRIRPELRWDFQGGGRYAFDDRDKKNQFLAGIDVLWQF